MNLLAIVIRGGLILLAYMIGVKLSYYFAGYILKFSIIPIMPCSLKNSFTISLHEYGK